MARKAQRVLGTEVTKHIYQGAPTNQNLVVAAIHGTSALQDDVGVVPKV